MMSSEIHFLYVFKFLDISTNDIRISLLYSIAHRSGNKRVTNRRRIFLWLAWYQNKTLRCWCSAQWTEHPAMPAI